MKVGPLIHDAFAGDGPRSSIRTGSSLVRQHTVT